MKKNQKKQNFWKSDNPNSSKGSIHDPISSQKPVGEKVLSQEEIDVAFYDYGFSKRLLNEIAATSIKSGFELDSGNEGIDKKVLERFKELECSDYIVELLENGMKDGICFLYPVILQRGAKATKDTLELKDIDRIEDFNIFYARDIFQMNRQLDKMKPRYNLLTKLTLNNQWGATPTVEIDSSRVIVYEPYPRPERSLQGTKAYGDSFLKRLWDLLLVKDNGIWSAGQLAYAALLKYLKIADQTLLDKMIEQFGKDKLQKKKALEMNSTTLALIGKDDEIGAVNVSQGINLQQLRDYIYSEFSMDTGIPVSKLIGTSQGALTSAKEDSLRWYEYVEKFQKDHLDEILRRVLAMLYAEQGVYNPKFELKFNSIRPKDEKEEAEIEKLKAEAAKTRVETLVTLEKSIKNVSLDPKAMEDLKRQILESLGIGE